MPKLKMFLLILIIKITDHVMRLGTSSRKDQILTNIKDQDLKKVCGGHSLASIIKRHVHRQGEVILQTDLKVREDSILEANQLTETSLLIDVPVKVPMGLNLSWLTELVRWKVSSTVSRPVWRRRPKRLKRVLKIWLK
jgi:hypothetical protein